MDYPVYENPDVQSLMGDGSLTYILNVDNGPNGSGRNVIHLRTCADVKQMKPSNGRNKAGSMSLYDVDKYAEKRGILTVDCERCKPRERDTTYRERCAALLGQGYFVAGIDPEGTAPFAVRI